MESVTTFGLTDESINIPDFRAPLINMLLSIAVNNVAVMDALNNPPQGRVAGQVNCRFCLQGNKGQ